MAKTKTTKTTLGDLIVALTEEATRLVPNRSEAYKVVAFALRDLLYGSGSRSKKLTIYR